MPSVRSRLVWAKAQSSFLEKPRPASAVAWVDDRLGFAFENGLADCPRVEQIKHDRVGTERPEPLAASRRPKRPDHIVASLDQLGNEPGTDGAARAGNENSHRVLLVVPSQLR